MNTQQEQSKEEQIHQDWLEMYKRCFVYPWSWGVLQPEYVYFEKPLVIMNDLDVDWIHTLFID